MYLPRLSPLFYQDGRFRCRLKRHEVEELLANREADPKCDRCGSLTIEGSCFGGEQHEVILMLRPVNFDRKGARYSITHAEIEANAGAHGVIPRVSVKHKLAEMFGS